MKIRSNLSKNVVATAESNLKAANWVEAERQRVLIMLKSIILHVPKNGAPVYKGGPVDLSTLTVPLQQHSTFFAAHTLAQEMLDSLLRSQEVKNQLVRYKERDLDQVVFSEDGTVRALWENDERDISTIFYINGGLKARLHGLVEIAKLTGGEIRRKGDPRLEQWLNYHQLSVPKYLEDVQSLVSFLEFEWPEHDRLDNYWEQLRGEKDGVVLSIPEYAEIRGLTAQFVTEGKGLLDFIYKKAVPALSGFIAWETANEVIQQLLTCDFSQQLARKYIVALGWYGAANGEEVDQGDLAQVLATAIILDLNPSFGKEEKRNHVGTYDLFGPALADKSMDVVRDGLEKYLVDSGRVSSRLCPLASHLLLADMAPGYLVRNLPQGLYAGSVKWVTFTQAVALVELSVKGASRSMTYDQVMIFADAGAISEQLGELQAITAIGSIVDWALLNQVITHELLAQPEQNACEHAIATYQAYIESLVSTTKVFATPLPSRRAIALAALQDAAPGCDFLQEKLLQEYRNPYGPRREMLDLHIEGKLNIGEWDWDTSRQESLFVRYPKLLELKPNQAEFEKKVGKHHRDMHKALATNIKLIMSSMLIDHLKLFESSKVTFFTFRRLVTELIHDDVSGFGGTGSAQSRWLETQANRDAATGRYGIVMCTSKTDGEIVCYEVFPLLNKCRLNNELGSLIQRSGIMDVPSRLQLNEPPHRYLNPPRASRYPTDFKSYTDGTEPAQNSSDATVLDKLGELPAPAVRSNKTRSAFQYFSDPNIQRITDFIIKNHPLATLDELVLAATEYTEAEQKSATYHKVADFIINMVVPFKSCIEDLTSGDKDRIGNGVKGCIFDAVGIIFTVLGAPTKILSIAAKTVSLATKLALTAKFALKLTLSIANPIDGLPTLAYKSLHKCGLKLGREGLELIEKASSQLNRVTGRAKSVDLLRNANLPDLGAGTWRPRGSVVDIPNVVAIRKGSSWFGVNRLGRAWGKRLVNIDFKHTLSLPTLRKPVPTSLSSQILRRTLPAAIHKVDSAITALSFPALQFKNDLAIGLILGVKASTRDRFSRILQIVKLDIPNLAIRNFLTSNVDDSQTLLQLDYAKYLSWKKSGMALGDQPFLNISNENLFNRFVSSGYSHFEVADDLIHEMFLVDSQRKDLVSASTGANRQPGLNVAPLLNLVAGHLAVDDRQGSSGGVDSYDPLENADSLAIATSLLCQILFDEKNASRNIEIMQKAVEAHAGRPIEDEVMINLNAY